MGEFAVHGAGAAGSVYRIVGRCYGGPLRLGNVFEVFDHDGMETEVSLLVTEIVIYNTRVPEIDEGLTASLLLSGEGFSKIKEGGVLRTGESNARNA